MTASTHLQTSSKRYPHTVQGTINDYAQQEQPSDAIPHHPPIRNVPPAVPSPPPLSSRYPVISNTKFFNKPATLHTINMPSHESQWIFPADVMLQTPSTRHGLPVAEERSRRAKGVNFIIQAAIMLRLPQTTISTAAVYFHRFYMRYSLVPEKNGIHHYVGSIFLTPYQGN